jgi:hypothetical protein
VPPWVAGEGPRWCLDSSYRVKNSAANEITEPFRKVLGCHLGMALPSVSISGNT